MLVKVKSPNGKEVVVGEATKDTITFFITEPRFFREAEGGKGAIGFDANLTEKVLRREWLVFKMWTGASFKVRSQDFVASSWLYPNAPVATYKAHGGVFVQKRVIVPDKLKALHDQVKEKEAEERLKIALS